MRRPAIATPEGTRAVTLTERQAAFAGRLVASGRYASVGEVVEEGLRALREEQGALEHRLREEVLPGALVVEAEPGRLIPADEVFAEVRGMPAREADRVPGGA
jgi:putative addiction module CopG family antidote